jgi:predicted short-subunit dehydrogenase-like oxidoreductase (DUF2520 family)
VRVGVIGAGKVGSAVAILLQRGGYQISGVASRSAASAERLAARLAVPAWPALNLAGKAELLLLTTPDDAIAQVAAELAAAGAFQRGQLVVHMSGALSSEALAPAAEKGAIALSLHPIQSFASVEQALELIPGSYFSIEGDSRGYEQAVWLVQTLGGSHFFLDAQSKALYHAAAVEASNYLVALLASSLELLAAAGVPEEVRLPAFLPLVEGTLRNIKSLGIPQALTGPIARGDLGTLHKHLQAMQSCPEQRPVYSTMGLAAVELALAKGGIDQERAGQIRRLLSGCSGGKAAATGTEKWPGH